MSHRGSKRCVLELVDNPSTFLPAINTLIPQSGAIIKSTDSWLPVGLKNDKEAELKDFLAAHFSPKLGLEIRNWWLAHSNGRTRTPNWDLISTCSIDGEKGILLVEAKAHYGELESSAKPSPREDSENSKKNHEKIRAAIEEANQNISLQVPSSIISIDCCYQLSNRVAHAWWLANQGFQVVLMYLGFRACKDMPGRRLFIEESDWENCFREKLNLVGLQDALNRKYQFGKGSLQIICSQFTDK